jgi:hypothetical protein
MNEQPDRVAEFTNEIESMKLKATSATGEKRLLVLGLVAVVAGLVLTVVGGINVVNNPAPADQRAYMATGAFIGIALIIAGAAFFIRYSLARYLRFWLLRLVWESRANSDRIVDAIDRASQPR